MLLEDKLNFMDPEWNIKCAAMISRYIGSNSFLCGFQFLTFFGLDQFINCAYFDFLCVSKTSLRLCLLFIVPWTLFWRVRVEFGIVVLWAYCSLAAQNNKWHRVRVLLIEWRYLSDFCLLCHSKFAPICLLMQKVEMHRSSTAKKGRPNSVTKKNSFFC